MDKKYSVFVSSTYEDLKEARQEVVNALLQMNCFPIGMEYFNASDKSQWEVIKSLIDECDYYVLIIAGKYGSVEPKSGKSYTQLEYEYAKKVGVPTIAFLHEKPETLPNMYVEEMHKRELEEFRAEVKKHLVKFWTDTTSLAGQVVLSLNPLFKASPRVGWMRADEMSSNEQNKEILRLKNEVDALHAQIREYEENGPDGTEDLCQGEDAFIMEYSLGLNEKNKKCSMSWNEICKVLLPIMTQDCTEFQMKHALEDYIAHKNDARFAHMAEHSLQTIKVQLLALGYIEEGAQPKTKKEYIGIWRLTKYGKTILMRLNALRKTK